MIYIVFALILAAAVMYLYFAEARQARIQVHTGSVERNQLVERLQSLKLSLRDIEYERTVGKTDGINHGRLQNEYLSEYAVVEAKIVALDKLSPPPIAKAAKFCAQCGAAVLSTSAKFCHACGSALTQLLLVICVFVSLLWVSQLSAYDIEVTIVDGVTKSIATAPIDVQLLKLEKGMQPVSAQKSKNGNANFMNLPEMTAGPYMVQAQYRGVLYSRVITPNMASPAKVKLEIFESTASSETIRVRTLVELRRSDKDSLSGLMILFFLNSGKRTFVGGNAGLEFYLPAEAILESSSISVGSGASNIQWLKLNAEKQPTGRYAVGQNIKPGDRVLQVAFRVPYTDNKANLTFQSIYPQDTGMQFIIEPDNVAVSAQGRVLTRIPDKNLGRGVIPFALKERKVEFSLSGGSVVAVHNTKEEQLEVKSPLEFWQKFVFPLIALVIFIAVAELRQQRSRQN